MFDVDVVVRSLRRRFIVLVETEGGGRRAFLLPNLQDFAGLVLGLNALCCMAAGRSTEFTFLRDMQWSPLVAFA